MSLLSVATKAAGAAASTSSSSAKTSVAAAGSSVGKGASGVTVSTTTTKPAGPTGVAAIANAFDPNGGKSTSSSPAVIKSISAAGTAAAAGGSTSTKASTSPSKASATLAAPVVASAGVFDWAAASRVLVGAMPAAAALATVPWLMLTSPAGQGEDDLVRQLGLGTLGSKKAESVGEDGDAVPEIKKMSDKELKAAAKANDYKDAHDLKKDYRFGSETDIYVDKKGNLYGVDRGGHGAAEPLGINKRGN
jgi:hypothetical protein